MGFNKKIIGVQHTFDALRSNKLDSLYHKVDSFLFEGDVPLKVYKLFQQGKKEKEIITLLNIEL